ncbi:hypothetical protein [Erythrobacter aureus]|uniref:Uncharacterized protein n=1 Tax=Erythrobacter aureus TaxID=2182384 RepID=A0A345YJ99_9SPHN|nr:hypothetical protein [Erythrobacter aureus]AXK44001.1 hypothetical protein DVR09_16235 [Erythrobacter aureus]
MTFIRKMMNTVEEAQAELKELGYTMTVKKDGRILRGKIYQKAEKSKREDLFIGANLSEEQREQHPELCHWLDHNAIADGSKLVVFSAARR